MRLTELEPQFVRYEKQGDKVYLPDTDDIRDAMGVMFLCPKCYVANGNSNVGTHSVICWSSSRGTPADAEPLPGRWKIEGTGYEDLTLNGETGGARSILLTGGCAWHGFITNGEVT
jgi:hypothetical protein